MSRFLLAVLFCSAVPVFSASVGIRVLFGLGDNNPVKWDGSVEARNARIASLEPWRFDADDALLPDNAWKATTHRVRRFAGARAAQAPFVPNGVIVWLEDVNESTQLSVKTPQGEFTVALRDIPYGKQFHALNNKALADRVPPATKLTDTPDEQDYPAAAAAPNGDIWLTYLEFRHHAEHNQIRANLTEPPADLSRYALPPPGDQIFAKRFSNGSWSAPIAVSDAGGDLYRPAVAIDGSGRAWVFWSANQNRNFDIWAKPLTAAGQAGKAIRLTTEAGSDVYPVATTDSKGRVWVAWQAWRNGKAEIRAAVQSGDGFGKEMTVSNSTANEWNPAIAADKQGRVSVAWDSYRNGNYDIYVRTTNNSGSWDKPERVAAATARYEAYPSVAYDPGGRLWVAWEEGGEHWGKDFGAYEVGGVAVYQGRAIRIRGFEQDGRAVELPVDVGTVLPGPVSNRIDDTNRQNTNERWLVPRRLTQRSEVADERLVPGPKNSLPRISFDSSGRLWIAIRSLHPLGWNPVGHVWTEHVASFDGKEWTGPIYLSHSDNLLDNRPAVLSTKPGEFTVIGSSDYRRRFDIMNGPRPPRQAGNVTDDPYQNDLFLNTVELPPATAPLNAKASTVDPAPASDTEPEKKMIGTMRQYRGAANTQIVRGEFHRHSEVSADGGAGDGMLIDQWRYILDAAGMDWVGCCDHDNGAGREWTWWLTQKYTDMFYTPGKFVPMFSYERSVAYPEGHRNVLFVQRGIRPLPRLPKMSEDSKGRAPDTQMLYDYLRKYNGIVASHTSATQMGTDWRDNDPIVEPIVEIYQGDRQNYEMPGAPREITSGDAIGGWRPAGFVNLALEMGYKLGFQSSSDHVSTHMSYANILATDRTREGVMDALKKRHVYGSTDNIIADVRSGNHMMGDAFETSAPPEIRVKLTGSQPFRKVHIIKNNKYVYSTEPNNINVNFTWRDQEAEKGKMAYYYVRGEQTDGELVWASPMWITYK